MRTDDLIPLAGLDEHCAIHQFIRVYGRRPTPAELIRCLQTPAPAAPSAGVGSPVTGRRAMPRSMPRSLRREVAQLLDRIS